MLVEKRKGKAREGSGQRATAEVSIATTRKTEKVCNLNFSANGRPDFSAVIFAVSQGVGGIPVH
jgi:hypothetical protein